MGYPDGMNMREFDRRNREAPDYITPEPGAVEKFARELAPTLVADFVLRMKVQFPKFELDPTDTTPGGYLVDSLNDLAFHYFTICRDEREHGE